MDRYNVSIELRQDFPIDVKGLKKWAKDNLELEFEMGSDNFISFYKEGELAATEDENFKSDEHKQLKEHHDSLIEEDEATKLALPSRLEGQVARDWESAKKAEIAAVTDYSLLTESQKKLWMGLPLTDEEKDALGV